MSNQETDNLIPSVGTMPTADTHESLTRQFLARCSAGRSLDAWTVPSLMESLRRQWPFAVAGLLAALVGTYLAATASGVYYQQAEVIFMAPRTSHNVNPFRMSSDSLVSVAGLVSRQLDERGGPLAFSQNATIVDMGIRDGVWVRLPNFGSQWTPSFERAELDVQVVGETPERVREEMASTMDRIRTVLRNGQLAVGASPGGLIQAGMSPQSPPVLYISGSRSRAAIAAMTLGLGLTVMLSMMVDRWRMSATTTSSGARSTRRLPKWRMSKFPRVDAQR